MNELRGAGVALITPFNTDGTVDYESLGNLIDYQIKEGMDYLVVLGTTGETATLQAEERKQVWEYTAARVAGRLPLVAGIGGNNTQEIVKQVDQFDMEGYCAILSVSPYYNKPTQEGIFQHYKAISAVSKLPIVLYNVPGRTGSNIAPATAIRLAKTCPNIIGIKEASASFAQFSEIMRDKPEEFMLISGDDPATLPMMALGGVGVISVVGNAYPQQVAALVKACAAADFTTARTIHSSLLKITDLCFIEGNPCGVKYILKKQGIMKSDAVRLPLVPVSTSTQEAIEKEMAFIG